MKFSACTNTGCVLKRGGVKMKKLYIVISDNGDGSSSTHYTFDSELIKRMEAAMDEGTLSEQWYDGDGFHYDELYLPDECTMQSLGIPYEMDADDIFTEW